MLFAYFLRIIAWFFRLGITTVKVNPDPTTSTDQAGAMVTNDGVLRHVLALSQNAGPAFGNFTQTLIPNTPVARTYTGGEFVGGIIRRFTPSAAFTDCTPTATDIVAAIPGAKVNQSFITLIANLGSGLMTLGAGTGVTISGTATIGSARMALFLGQVTGSAAVTVTNCFNWNLGTGGTGVAGL